MFTVKQPRCKVVNESRPSRKGRLQVEKVIVLPNDSLLPDQNPLPFADTNHLSPSAVTGRDASGRFLTDNDWTAMQADIDDSSPVEPQHPPDANDGTRTAPPDEPKKKKAMDKDELYENIETLKSS